MGCGRSCITPQPIIKEKNEPRTPANTPSRPSSVDYSMFLATVNVHPHLSEKEKADTVETSMTQNTHPHKISVVHATLCRGGRFPRKKDTDGATVLPSKTLWKAYEHLSFTNYGNISIFYVKNQNVTSSRARFARTMSTSTTERRKSRDAVSVEDARLGGLGDGLSRTPLVPPQQPETPRDGAGKDCRGNGTSDRD